MRGIQRSASGATHAWGRRSITRRLRLTCARAREPPMEFMLHATMVVESLQKIDSALRPGPDHNTFENIAHWAPPETDTTRPHPLA